jgi:hypothetical protein
MKPSWEPSTLWIVVYGTFAFLIWLFLKVIQLIGFVVIKTADHVKKGWVRT